MDERQQLKVGSPSLVWTFCTSCFTDVTAGLQEFLALIHVAKTTIKNDILFQTSSSNILFKLKRQDFLIHLLNNACRFWANIKVQSTWPHIKALPSNVSPPLCSFFRVPGLALRVEETLKCFMWSCGAAVKETSSLHSVHRLSAGIKP